MAEIAEEQPRRGASGTCRCVLDSLLRRRPAIRYDGPFPRNFDAVVLVSPVWLGRLAGPMRSFVARRQDHLPAVAVISVAGGRGEFDVVAEIADLIGEEPIISADFTAREVEDGTCSGRLRTFGVALLGAEEAHAAARRSCLSPQVA
ncbi:flavodoxin [Variovorax sp. WS11]|nr:flavodoxin [Variovorax sp. WS11]